jgi:hypothetical protein
MAAIEPVQFAASILAADFCRLGEQVEEAMKAGIRFIHSYCRQPVTSARLALWPALPLIRQCP